MQHFGSHKNTPKLKTVYKVNKLVFKKSICGEPKIKSLYSIIYAVSAIMCEWGTVLTHF